MVAKKKIYVHFENPVYIGGKSELLKIQMDILYLKKMVRNLALSREKKIHYRQMLGEVLIDMKKRLEKLSSFMPDDSEISWKIIGKEKPAKKPVLKKKVVLKDSNSKKNFDGGDEIENELLEIKQKLDALNRI
jgi:hypothetical protein